MTYFELMSCEPIEEDNKIIFEKDIFKIIFDLDTKTHTRIVKTRVNAKYIDYMLDLAIAEQYAILGWVYNDGR